MAIGYCILIFGGVNAKTVFSDLHIYNTLLKSWFKTETTGMKPHARSRASLNLLEHNQLVLFGGYYCHENTLNCLSSLFDEKNFNDLNILFMDQNNRWKQILVDNPPPGRSGHTGNIVNSCLYIFGGVEKKDASPVYLHFFKVLNNFLKSSL